MQWGCKSSELIEKKKEELWMGAYDSVGIMGIAEEHNIENEDDTTKKKEEGLWMGSYDSLGNTEIAEEMKRNGMA